MTMMKDKIRRIGIDCRLWNETGVGRYIRNLVWELANIDKKNSYFLFFRKNEYDNVELPGENFTKVLADIRWHTIDEQLKLPRILNKYDLDLVHFPYFSVPILYTKPFVVTIHDLIINHFSTGMSSTKSPWIYQTKLLGYKFVLHNTIKHAKKIIVPSEATKQEVLSSYHVTNKNIIVTYEGVDSKLFHTNYKLTIKDPYFLYVGNAYPHKNLDRLIEAFNIFLQQDIKNTKLVLVGKQDFFYERLKKHIKLIGLDSHILFYEKVSDAGLASLYHFAKALIVPSVMEGFGLPALEAMANDCLVMASDIPSLQEVCKTAALYFDPYNISDIVKKLHEIFVLSQQEITEKKEKGKERLQHFSWNTMAKQTKEIYESSISVR